MNFIYLSREIWKGESLTRAMLNMRLSHEKMQGNTIDIGGGKNNEYLSFMPRDEGVRVETLDMKLGMMVDFEKDRLPAHDGEYNTVLFLNVLEHIYNYRHIMSEVIRITKTGGRIIGFVPFLMWYHPDHSDYFRYTHEALEKIFNECGVKKFTIEGIARGPFTAAAQMITQSVPSILRVPIFTFFYTLDSIFLWLRPRNGEKYVLGYYFMIEK